MNCKTRNFIFILFVMFLMIFIFINYLDKSLNITKINTHNLILEQIEKTFKKIYPIGNDHFAIKHSPKYYSFFDQFKKHDYYVSYSDDKLINGTCAIALLKNNLHYICDLKTNTQNKNTTAKFIFRYYCELVKKFNFDLNLFGIVMQPNPAIDKLVGKYWFVKKCEELVLYQIKYREYLKNYQTIKSIFGNHFFVSGYKSLILESTQKPLKICHLATFDDEKYVNVQNPITDNLNNYEIMFCVVKSSDEHNKLQCAHIDQQSLMTIFSLFNCNHSWKFIRTYMI